MARGRRAKGASDEPTPNMKWQAGDRVSVDFDGVNYQGEIAEMKLEHKVAVVNFDDGDTQEIDLTRLAAGQTKRVVDDNGEDDSDESVVEVDGDEVTFNPPPKGHRGMHIYPIVWDKQGINFRVFAAPDGNDLAISESGDKLIHRLRNRCVEFYGWWRKTNFHKADASGRVQRDMVVGYSIDMYAKVPREDGDGHDEYMVESIPYEDAETGDPRSDMHALNSDICVAIRHFFFVELRGDRETITQLRRRAANPAIVVPSLQWLDRLLIKMREVRDTALRSGGQRSIVIQTDDESDPVVTLRLDFTGVAILTEGKVPNIYEGTMHEAVHRSGGRKGGERPQQLQVKMEDENLQALAARVKELNARAKQGDMSAKSEARKIRAILRQGGHRGGARALGD